MDLSSDNDVNSIIIFHHYLAVVTIIPSLCHPEDDSCMGVETLVNICFPG